ncbi:hypothetical protein CB0940_10104 [Cercospora beticola]|uniref:G domain-containing protein n=1 Tax=Cercospora beticola TaxID=122368 RepID=A0A2G5HT45_CERBT|nr:hypothetical protein CB0940_10104 [Cercospora beticola]PIA95696.1 hypothetical protein CB0940_10104 [Cercospora beticola]WPB06808.1 hypothetical protein RHO25_011468 [Cercospora beticola]CAK1366720.1 unnamed protein product [Cercospora beticola]
MVSGSKAPIRIAVMGVTGSGKSTFIQRASQADVGIGHSLSSYTADVAPYDFELDGHQVTLIDTPGFNDTVRSEAEVLTAIANYMDFTYRNPPHLKLNGIIYLQSIQDPRMYGSSLRNLKMFKDLCGESPMKNVVLVTNRWEDARVTGQEQQARDKEVELRTRTEFWQPLLKRGAQMMRCEDSHESALTIVRRFINNRPEVLQIQTELVEQSKPLIETKAGTTVNEEALRVEKKYQAELDQIRKEMDEARAAADLEVQEALELSKKEYERKLDKVRDEQELLRYERRNESRRMQSEMDDLKAAYERELGKHKLDFEDTVRTLLANQDRLREEQRRVVTAEIEAMKKKPKDKRSGTALVVGLVKTVGSVALSSMGIPMGLIAPVFAFLTGGGSGGEY